MRPTRSWLVPAVSALAALLVAGSAHARLKVTVTTAKDFDVKTVQKIAVVTTQCHEAIDCSDLERRVAEEIRELDVALKTVPEVLLRDFLFEKGATEYAPEHRSAIAEKFEIDAFLELEVPFAVKGDGFGGRESSQVKLELRLTKIDGSILLFGVGTGRPNNVVSSPERVAGNLAEAVIKKAFK